MTDVYDVGRAVWCNLCSAAHLPCEPGADGEDRGIGDSYCGCCGRDIDEVVKSHRGRAASRTKARRARGMDLIWCLDCEDHVIDALHLWEGTYFAQHHADCPFQENP